MMPIAYYSNNELTYASFFHHSNSMVNQVWDASMKKNSKRIRVDFHHESFAY
jgi:hypothetical protein